ncbi:hypothetical protein C1H46_044096 [Malus baccata]|uniref:Uncharacterized protein n=1 Tax=Malus baccata TaxID=106549 RepID=A0A540K834_MALBA|nr:hypothetical protein C1H46_044096 [Malus baccata]
MPLVCGSMTTTWVKLWSPVLRAPRLLPEHSNIDFRRSHKLLGDEFHYGQAEVLSKEMADFDGSSRRCEDDRQLYFKDVLHWLL